MTLDDWFPIYQNISTAMFTVLGLIITIKPQYMKYKSTLVFTFIFLGLTSIGATIWQQARISDQRDEDRKKEIQNIKDKASAESKHDAVESARDQNIAFLKGQLSAVIINTSEDDNNDNKLNERLANAFDGFSNSLKSGNRPNEPDRGISQEIIEYVQKNVKDKDAYISIAPISADRESLSFIAKNVKALKELGYKNAFQNGTTMAYGATDSIVYQWDDKTLTISVPSK